jgi:membrane protease YdiL (CAAX protease family)
MNHFIYPLIFIAIVYLGIIVANERFGLLRATDRFTPLTKVLAYAWLGLFLFVLTMLVVASSLRQPTPRELSATPFYSLFTLHLILLVFLGVWWLLSGRPPLLEFLNIQRRGAGEAVMTGMAVGVAGWIATLMIALLIAAILSATGLMPKPPKASPMIGWLAALPLWKKATVVFSAMTVEEAFFRGWLQKRIGVIFSTLLFALAHAGFGQPLLLVGVTIISLIIGFTFYRTKNLIPGIVAHGVFDAVQLFVIIPIVFKAAGLGGA